jgi:hypothetical protein
MTGWTHHLLSQECMGLIPVMAVPGLLIRGSVPAIPIRKALCFP